MNIDDVFNDIVETKPAYVIASPDAIEWFRLKYGLCTAPQRGFTHEFKGIKFVLEPSPRRYKTKSGERVLMHIAIPSLHGPCSQINPEWMEAETEAIFSIYPERSVEFFVDRKSFADKQQ
jgi:hypothetical protein